VIWFIFSLSQRYFKGLEVNTIMKRPLCKNCRKRPAAVNYKRNGVTHYRSKCDSCLTAKKRVVPSWMQSGYKKKMVCDQCGFKATTSHQITVFHIDGDLRNNNWLNLKSVCANCAIEITIKDLAWKEGTIKPDF